MTCGYEGPHFGGGYNDAGCVDGYLWDLDSYEDGMLTSGGDVACPCCNTREYIEDEGPRLSGNAGQRRKKIRALVRKVKTWARAAQAPNAGEKA